MKENSKKKSTAVCAVSVFLIILTLLAVISHQISKYECHCRCQKIDD
jgi:hypothetical protein